MPWNHNYLGNPLSQLIMTFICHQIHYLSPPPPHKTLEPKTLFPRSTEIGGESWGCVQPKQKMIATISWVPKGVAKSVPVEVEPPSKEEIEEIMKNVVFAKSEESEDDGNEDMDLDADKQVDEEVAQALAAANALNKTSANTTSGTNDITDALRELNMDQYDEEDDNGIKLFSVGLGDTYYASNNMDPYLKDKDDDDEEEIEDMTIRASDAVIICGIYDSEDAVSQLQVCVVEELDDGDFNMYSHHDIILSTSPLCTEWLDCNLKGGDKGNFIAIGLMEQPGIEVWDLDLVDEVQPFMVLGGSAKKKKGKKTSYEKDSHTDSVLGLAWNKDRNWLASASADKSVKIWDMAKGECIQTIKHHTHKVQAVAWNHHDRDILLSGSFDRSVIMMDLSTLSHPGVVRYIVNAEVESLAWDPHDKNSFVVSLEDGTVQGFDVQDALSGSCKPRFTLHAHDKAVCSVSFNPAVPKMLATGSEDKTVKLWDLSNNQPSCIASKNPKAGAVFSVSFSEDSPFLLAMGGSKGKLQVWDTLVEPGVARKFGKYSKRKVNPAPDTTPQD